MGIVPRQLVDRVQFFETRLGAFAEHAAAIGLEAGEVAELRARADAARAAHQTQQVAAITARAATATFNHAVADLNTLGAALIAKVRARAQATGDPGVCILAQIPAVARRSPTPAPGTPGRFAARLDGDGSLLLSWACRNPRGSTGTLYEVRRRVGGGDFAHLATVGRRRYVDATIPAGATVVVYEVRAVRSTGAGPSAIFNVNFGSNRPAVADVRLAA